MSSDKNDSVDASSPEIKQYSFTAEINQLMHLIINTFYSDKQIFLRELVSNSSDALDKIRFLSLSQGLSLEPEAELCIRIETTLPSNGHHGILSIRDTGIGMTATDLVNNLGTIAHSGTKAFTQSLRAGNEEGKNNVSLIGQFGVGFYSAFLVADRTRVISKHPDDIQHVWESTAKGGYTITPDPRGEIGGILLGRGTLIQLYLKEDQGEYLKESCLREIISKHSQFIQYPIYLQTTRHVEREVPVSSKTDKEEIEEKGQESRHGDGDETSEKDNDDEIKVSDIPESEGLSQNLLPTSKEKIKEEVKEWIHLNTQAPIWTRRPEEITEEEYQSFYKALSNDWQPHLKVKHFKVDGSVNFTAMLFIPKQAPYDLFDHKKRQNNIKLYVKRVFVTDDCSELIPEWLSFVKGMVDSDDLPLTISREMLQQSKICQTIRKSLVKKCLDLFQELAEEDKDDFKKFYEQFSKNLKYGLYEDAANRDKLADICRWMSSYTTANDSPLTSLKSYISRMKPEQKHIYYITGESLEVVRRSPFVERLKEKNLEVLYLVDPIDEYVTQQLREYDGKKMMCITKAGLELPETEAETATRKSLEESNKTLCDRVKSILGDRVTKVVISARLTNSPCVLVSSEYGWTSNMERIVKAQALRDNKHSQYMTGQKVLELNPNSKIVAELRSRLLSSSSNESASEDKTASDLCILLFETAQMASGYSLNEPSSFADRIYRMIRMGLSLPEEEAATGQNQSDNSHEVNPSKETLELDTKFMEAVD